MTDVDYHRLHELKVLIDSGGATTTEKNEYMKKLFDNGNIKKEQYESFIQGKNSDNILRAGSVIGGFVLLHWVVFKFLEKKY